MGREIRRVPADWQHPTQYCPHRYYRSGCETAQKNGGLCFRPVLDHSFRESAEEWHRDYMAWADGTHNDAAEHKAEFPYYWQWAGNPPTEEYYRPDWPEESRTAYQVYETVSEGTPVSPVFQTRDELHSWLMNDPAWKLSAKGADSFIESAWAPSMVMEGGQCFTSEQVHDHWAETK